MKDIDIDLYSLPLAFPTTTKTAFHHNTLPHETSQYPHFGVGFALDPRKSDQGPRSPHPSNPAIKDQVLNESEALQSVTAQLDRIELRGASGASKEDVQRLEMSCASKANVESLEIRVQRLEKAHRLPESNQISAGHEEVVMKMAEPLSIQSEEPNNTDYTKNSTLSEHLAAIQGQYDSVCAKRDEAGQRADGCKLRRYFNKQRD